MKILFLSPNQRTRWNPGHQHFRDEIGVTNDVKYYGPGYRDHQLLDKLNYIPRILEYYENEMNWIPDVIMTYGLRYTIPFIGFKKVKLPKIHFICDFTPFVPNKWPGTIGTYKAMLDSHEYDLHFSLSYQVMNWFAKNDRSKCIRYLPFGVDEKVFYPKKLTKMWDVYVGWSNHDTLYPFRKPLQDELKNQATNGLRVLIKRVFQQGFVETMNMSNIVLNTSNIFNTMNMKTFEVMACASLLLTEYTQELEDLGYEDMIHYVSYSNITECMEKIYMLLNNPEMMQDIADEGYRLTVSQNTNAHRVSKMMEMIHETL